MGSWLSSHQCYFSSSCKRCPDFICSSFLSSAKVGINHHSSDFFCTSSLYSSSWGNLISFRTATCSNDFFGYLIDKKLEGNELGKERYASGYLDPFELMSDEIPRFVSVDDLRKVAEKNGFDINIMNNNNIKNYFYYFMTEISFTTIFHNIIIYIY